MIYLTHSIHQNAKVRGAAIATIYNGRERTWSELKDRISRFAGALANIGISAGDRVAILAFNSDRYFEYYFGVPWAGACVVPLNIRWSILEIAQALKEVEAKALVIDDAFVSMLPALKAQGVNIASTIFIGEQGLPKGMLDYEKLLTKYQPIEDACRNNEDLAGIFYTGGTTGLPRGVMLSHANLRAIADCMPVLINLTENSKILHAGPMFHAGDLMMTMSGIVAGVTHTFIAKFSSTEALKKIASQKVTHISIVPTMIQRFLRDNSLEYTNLSSLEVILYGAAPMPEVILKEALQAFPDTLLINSYGQTELSPLVTVFQPKYQLTKEGKKNLFHSVGKPIPNTKIHIVDSEGAVLPKGTVGEILVKGPQAMLGYWNKPKETALVLRDGWVHTGDLGYLDEHDFLFIVDRLKDMIISGGENIYSIEVENAICKHPDVEQVLVMGIPSSEWGEQVHGEVILKEGSIAVASDIINTAKKYLAPYKCPKSISFRTSPFPISGAGKLIKQEVRKAYLNIEKNVLVS